MTETSEIALNAAWLVLKQLQIPDGLLGVFFMNERQTFVLHYEEEGSGYVEWARLSIASLDNLETSVLEEAAQRLAARIAITRARFKVSELKILS